MSRFIPESIAGIVFDCDGVLADTERLWDATTLEYAREYSVELQGISDLFGGTLDDCAQLLSDQVPQLGYDSARKGMLARLEKSVVRDAAPIPGAVELVLALQGRIPMAAASNSPRELLTKVLDTLGFARAFVGSVSCDDVRSGKPAPDVYLQGAKIIGAEPTHCVAFEDSPTGSYAATAAGFFVVGVNPDPSVELYCSTRITNFEDPRLVAWTERVQEIDPRLSSTH